MKQRSKSFLALCSAALLGVFLGAMYRPASVKAQKQGGLVKVYEASPSRAGTMIYSGQVVGFSCSGDTCYVAVLQ